MVKFLMAQYRMKRITEEQLQKLVDNGTITADEKMLIMS